MIVRTPWSRIGELLTSETVTTALRLSLVVATAAAAISFVTGFPLAWMLVRGSFRGKTIIRAAVVLPLVMPPVVAGVGLIAAFGRRGIAGSWLYEWFGWQITFTTGAAVLAATFVSFPLAVLALEAGLRGLDERLEDAASTLGASRWYVMRRITLPLMAPQIVAAFGRRGIAGSWLYEWFGWQITFTTGAAVLAATFVSFPLAVLALEAGLRGLDERLEDAASTLGASRWYVLRRVTLPLMAPQIAAALVLSWARALGEFGATITFAGNLQGRTQTLPLAVFERLQTDPEAAFAVSMLLIAIAFAVIVGLRGRFLR